MSLRQISLLNSLVSLLKPQEIKWRECKINSDLNLFPNVGALLPQDEGGGVNGEERRAHRGVRTGSVRCWTLRL